MLVLNTAKNTHQPLLLNLLGQEVGRGFVFSYHAQTEVYQSCAVTFKNVAYVLGGYREKRQVSKYCVKVENLVVNFRLVT